MVQYDFRCLETFESSLPLPGSAALLQDKAKAEHLRPTVPRRTKTLGVGLMAGNPAPVSVEVGSLSHYL